MTPKKKIEVDRRIYEVFGLKEKPIHKRSKTEIVLELEMCYTQLIKLQEEHEAETKEMISFIWQTFHGFVPDNLDKLVEELRQKIKEAKKK